MEKLVDRLLELQEQLIEAKLKNMDLLFELEKLRINSVDLNDLRECISGFSEDGYMYIKEDKKDELKRILQGRANGKE